MLQPFERQDDRPAVRVGRSTPVTCAACGCRLQETPGGRWTHFGALGGRDARGCRIACTEAFHDADGRVVA